MKDFSFFETILFAAVAAIIAFLLGLFLMKVKIDVLKKEINRIEKELMESHSETLKEIQDNVGLRKTIKELISKHSKKLF